VVAGAAEVVGAQHVDVEVQLPHLPSFPGGMASAILAGPASTLGGLDHGRAG
jgi:hypothetical protein